MLQATAKLNQKVPYDFKPDEQLDGKLVGTKISGTTGIIQETDTEFGLHGFIRPGPDKIAGDVTVIDFEGDADPSQEFSSIKETIEITWTAANATTLGGVLGAPVPDVD